MGLFNFLTYRKFRSEKWRTYSPRKRVALFQKMEKIMSRKMGRPMYHIMPRQFDDNTNGLCDYENKIIYINKTFFEEDYLQFYGLATLFHEERHAMQNNIVTKTEKPFRFSKAYKWKKDMESYIDYDEREKYSYYSMQGIERDANKYAIDRLKKLKFWFRYDNLYYKTLDLKIQQFDEVKNIAKKELGFFYKFKLKRRKDKEAKKRKNYW